MESARVTLRFDIREYDEVTSTNNLVKQAAQLGEPEGLVVCAKVQTAGYGRRGHNWESGEGGLYMSLLLRPDMSSSPSSGMAPTSTCASPTGSGEEASRMATLPLVVALAVRRAIASFLPADSAADVKVKWPNDVVFGEASPEGFGKMCGISTEWKSGSVCVGIGVNVGVTEVGSSVTLRGGLLNSNCLASQRDRKPDLCHTPHVRNLPTYISDILGEDACPSVAQVRDAVLRELAAIYETWLAQGFAPFHREYMRAFALLGAVARIDDAAVLGPDGSVVADEVPECTVEGVTDQGLLAVRPAGSPVPAEVASGTVTIIHFPTTRRKVEP